MAKAHLKLTIDIQAEGADIIKQNEETLTESLESIIEDIVPAGTNYQAELHDFITGITIKRKGGVIHG